MSKKHHTKLDWKAGQFVTSHISRPAIESIFIEKSYWMKYMCDKKGDLACRWSRDNLVADDRYFVSFG